MLFDGLRNAGGKTITWCAATPYHVCHRPTCSLRAGSNPERPRIPIILTRSAPVHCVLQYVVKRLLTIIVKANVSMVKLPNLRPSWEVSRS